MTKIPNKQRMYDLDKKLVKVKPYSSPFLPYIIQKPAWNFLQGIRTVVTKKMYKRMLKLLVENNPVSYQSRYPSFENWMNTLKPGQVMIYCKKCGAMNITNEHKCFKSRNN